MRTYGDIFFVITIINQTQLVFISIVTSLSSSFDVDDRADMMKHLD